MKKAEQAIQQWIIDNYKDNPSYIILNCAEHGVFARIKSDDNKTCPHCKKKCNVYKLT